MSIPYAVDTNVLLRLSNSAHPQHSLITEAMRRLENRDVEFCFTPQNLGEFWNVSTRPVDRNGLGLSVAETRFHIGSIERSMRLLPENEQVYHVWLDLPLRHQVRGIQVHDAHLAAVLEVHQVGHLLTLNAPDFKRFTKILPVHPEDIQR